MSDSSIVIIQGTVGLYTVATRCHTCFAVTLKYTEDSSLTILRHSLVNNYISVFLLLTVKPFATNSTITLKYILDKINE